MRLYRPFRIVAILLMVAICYGSAARAWRRDLLEDQLHKRPDMVTSAALRIMKRSIAEQTRAELGNGGDDMNAGSEGKLMRQAELDGLRMIRKVDHPKPSNVLETIRIMKKMFGTDAHLEELDNPYADLTSQLRMKAGRHAAYSYNQDLAPEGISTSALSRQQMMSAMTRQAQGQDEDAGWGRFMT